MRISAKSAKSKMLSSSGTEPGEPAKLRNPKPIDLSVEPARVLIISSKPTSLGMISELLKAMGYTWLSASGWSALTMLERESFQAIFIDLAHPSMSAHEMILKIGDIDASLVRGLLLIGDGAIDSGIAGLIQRHNLVHLSPDDLAPEELWTALQRVNQRRRRSPRPRAAHLHLPRLLLDTMNSPLPNDVRSLGTPFRQFVYEHQNVTIDILLESGPGSGHLLVTGQVLSARTDDAPRADLPVLLVSGTKTLARTTTDRFGEFHLEFEPVSNSALEIRLQERVWISIPLEGMPREGKLPL